MIVCPGCGGRNEPGATACTFCLRRTDRVAGATAALRPRLLPTRAVLAFAVCLTLILLALLGVVLVLPLLARPVLP